MLNPEFLPNSEDKQSYSLIVYSMHSRARDRLVRYKYSDNKPNTIHKIWLGDGDVQSTDKVRGLSVVEYSDFEELS